MNSVSFRICAVLLFIPLAIQTSAAGDINPVSLDTPYDQYVRIATHNSYANFDEDYNVIGSNQPDSITSQLDYGVRLINPDIWLVRQKWSPVLGRWRWETYTEESTQVEAKFFQGVDLEVVVGHGLDTSLALTLHDMDRPWKSLRAVLDDIGAWVDNHPNEVVSILFENKIAGAQGNHISAAINGSRIAKYIFAPNGGNPNVPAPEGRPGGWSVDRYGWPTLRQLVNANKRVVLYPTFQPREPAAGFSEDKWKLEVATVYGHACLPPYNLNQNWVLPRGESAWLDDFTRPLFSVIHVPDLPAANDYAPPGGINDINMLLSKWVDIRDRYSRLPTAIWLDYYERGFNGLFNPGDPPGPAMFVNELNALWQAQPAVTAAAQISPSANAAGWHNTSNVTARLLGGADRLRAIISRAFGATTIKTADESTLTLTNEGITTVSFYAVGNLGKRSPNQLVDVRIDRTPPTIVGSLDRPPDHNGWYTSNVIASFECADALSGVAFCMPDVILTEDGANQSVSGLAIDYADNQSTTTITNINIDTKPPLIRVSANPDKLWPPNNKFLPVVISGKMTDAASGVDPATALFSVRDEYARLQPMGPVALGPDGSFRFTLRLEARRSGPDKDGRKYLVRLAASDRAGHSTQTTLTILVPHDKR